MRKLFGSSAFLFALFCLGPCTGWMACNVGFKVTQDRKNAAQAAEILAKLDAIRAAGNPYPSEDELRALGIDTLRFRYASTGTSFTLSYWEAGFPMAPSDCANVYELATKSWRSECY